MLPGSFYVLGTAAVLESAGQTLSTEKFPFTSQHMTVVDICSRGEFLKGLFAFARFPLAANS
jgi:hypothetical protein